MEAYINQAKLRQTTLTYIASRIPESQIKDLRDAFIKFDKNGTFLSESAKGNEKCNDCPSHKFSSLIKPHNKSFNPINPN